LCTPDPAPDEGTARSSGSPQESGATLASRESHAYGSVMTSDPSMSRRVSRLENETESIYELITDVRSTQADHTRRLDRIEGTLAEVVRRLPEPS
jgi:hypothetical protein